MKNEFKPIKKFLADHIKHKRSIHTIKAKNRTDINGNHLWIGLVGFCALFVISIICLYAATVGFISNALAEVSVANPEIFMAAIDESGTLPIMSMAREMSGAFSIDGSFKGSFTTKTERYLEKVNLSCIDEYVYVSEANINHIPVSDGKHNAVREQLEQYTDKGCKMYYQTKNFTLLKCPKHNCAMKEVTRVVPDEFLPESVDLQKIQAEAGGDLKSHSSNS